MEDVERELGGLPEDHRHCARLAVNTLGEAVADAFRQRVCREGEGGKHAAGEVIVLNSADPVTCPQCGSTDNRKLMSPTSSMTGRSGPSMPGPGDTACCGSSPGLGDCAGPGSCCGRTGG